MGLGFEGRNTACRYLERHVAAGSSKGRIGADIEVGRWAGMRAVGVCGSKGGGYQSEQGGEAEWEVHRGELIAQKRSAVDGFNRREKDVVARQSVAERLVMYITLRHMHSELCATS
jgi:hypothetical protein